MIDQMVDTKQNERGLANPGSGLFGLGKQQQTETKKVALRDLQNDNRIMSPQNAANRGAAPIDGIKASGAKRPRSPPCRQSSSSNGTNGNLVYIRRKSEEEIEKNNNIDNGNNNANCPQLRQFSHGMQEASRQQLPLQGPKGYSAFTPIPGASINTYAIGGPSLPIGKPVNALPATGVNHTAVMSGSVNSQKRSDQDFKDRFLRLQTFLKSYDNSNHEEYNQMLRALSSVGRSKHAVELEKRAIHLLLEEKKELERMKILNVLGKSIPRDNASPSTTQAPSGK